jgi:tRNA(Ile)-lysidine synthase
LEGRAKRRQQGEAAPQGAGAAKLGLIGRVAESMAQCGVAPGAALLVGFSGGADSVALVEALREAGWGKLMLCHLDHGLRPESEADAVWAEQWAGARGLGFVSERREVGREAERLGVGLEEAGREVRYAFFGRLVERTGVDRVVLAHQADDQVETFLFRLMRGSGLGGLAGMSALSWREGGRWAVVRPFLGVWRWEIEAYLRALGSGHREDPSNAERRWTRNRIRHELLPAMEDAMGRPVAPVLWRLVEQLRAESEWADQREEVEAAAVPGEGGEGWTVAVLRGWPLALQRRRIWRWLREAGLGEAGFEDVERVLGLIRRRDPARVNLPRGWFARRRQGRIFLERGEG